MEAYRLFEEAKLCEARGDYLACLKSMTASLLIDPTNPVAWETMGNCTLKLGDAFYALLNYDRAIALKPDCADYHLNRGVCFAELQKYQKAFENYDAAIKLNPKFDIAYMNKANIYRVEKTLDLAEYFYRKAIECNPMNQDAHLGLAFSLLENGQFEEGWKEYDWRWKTDQLKPRNLPVHEWEGELADSPDDVLLFYSEQGFGDALQFIRYAPLLKKKWGGKVFVEVRLPMVRLAKTLKGIDGVVAFGEELPKNLKYGLPMMSAPKLMGTTIETIPNDVPYLYPQQNEIAFWNRELDKLNRPLKVGLCWAGGKRPFQPIASAVDKKRSTTLDEFKPLCLPNIGFASLQIGPEAVQVQTPPVGMHIGDWSGEIFDYYDTAAIIANLDLVITVDTSVVHIAGAMGKPVWLLSRFDNCWRWLGTREDSPWYPSLRQFIQPADGDWAGMMQQVRRELQQFCLSQRKAA